MRHVLALLALTTALPAAAQTDPQKLSDTVKTLASDEFGGRSPGTAGEKTTIDWLIARMKAIGLEPGGANGAWTQAVPLIHTRIGDGRMTIGDTAMAQGEAIAVTTVRGDPRIAIHDAPMVFVGYGVSAPEAKWDDFKGIDLKGKVAVILVNDPDFEAAAGDDAKGRFGDRRMTYYGRWTYKFEEAARRGAVAALIVHDTGGAGYPWSTVNASNGENYDIVRGADDPRLPLQGWIEHEAADRLFAAAGLDLAKLRVAARSAAFRPVAMKPTFSADLPVSVERIESANVLAKITGAKRPAESVMFGAHWDAYGEGPRDAAGKTLRPGANDDALGVAGILELARQFKAKPAPDRTLVFALWTAEERGLLGSEHYATHPIYPIATTAANLTLDILQTAGPAKDVIEVGVGNSSLDSLLADAAKAQGRTIMPETFSERGLFYRADHFSVVRKGVPSLLLMALGGAPDLKAGGSAAGQKWLDGYMACYHKTCDAWSADWDLRGAAQDVDSVPRDGRAAGAGGRLADVERGIRVPRGPRGDQGRAQAVAETSRRVAGYRLIDGRVTMAIKALTPAPELAALREPWPGESKDYGTARADLLAAEIDLRRQMTRLTEQRMALPPGPVIDRDYRFKDANGDEVGLIDLFGEHDTLVSYFWMYGPARERPCPMCTNWLGSVNGNATDIAQRVSLKIFGRSPVERQIAFAEERGWRNLDFVQTIGDDYADDLGLINDDGTENPAMAVFKRDGGEVRLFWRAEMPMKAADPGQDPRGAPDIASLWLVLDLTPEGRGTDWYPKLSY